MKVRPWRNVVGHSLSKRSLRNPLLLKSSPGSVTAKTEEASRWFSYVGENGTPVIVNVIKHAASCEVAVSFPVRDVSSVQRADLCWGLFRKEKGEWFRPDGKKIEDNDGCLKMSMTFSKSTSTYQVMVDIPQDIFPCYFGCSVQINGSEQILRPEQKLHFSIPLGILRGVPSPRGASLVSSPNKGSRAEIINFAVVSRNASSMTLCLVKTLGSLSELELLPEHNKTGDVWHVAIETTQNLDTLHYGWKAEGLYGWEGGSRFHPDTILTDPYSRHVTPTTVSQGVNSGKEIFLGSLGGLLSEAFDWRDVPRPRYGFEQLVIAELDLTLLPESKPVLQQAMEITSRMAETGVNAVVLRGATLSFEEHLSGKLAPFSFFAPNSHLFSNQPPSQTSIELKSLIKSCHQKSMEVHLEVQFCFTSEDEARMSLKGLDVSLYFRGKGVLNCGHPVVQELILDALHHWRDAYKVDGFVFSNAETMVQDRDGVIQDSPALPEAIAADPLLRMCKLIAVIGDDQLIPRKGERGFPHWSVWTEYNTRFQFDFWDFMVMTTSAKLSNIATRLTGSADLFAACWDGGFPGSLAAGRRPSFGFNSPVPSFTHLAPSIEADAPPKRTLGSDSTSTENLHLLCSLLTATIVSQGVPVSPMDCWLTSDLTDLIKRLLEFRRRYLDLIQPDAFDAVRGIEWHGALSGHQPEWEGGIYSHYIGYSLIESADRGFYVGFNAYDTELEVQAPDTAPGKTWRCAAYTGLPKTEKEILVPPLSMFHMSSKTAVILEIIPDPKAATGTLTPEH